MNWNRFSDTTTAAETIQGLRMGLCCLASHGNLTRLISYAMNAVSRPTRDKTFLPRKQHGFGLIPDT